MLWTLLLMSACGLFPGRSACVAGDTTTHAALGELVCVPSGPVRVGCVVGRDDLDEGCGPAEAPQDLATEADLWVMAAPVTVAQWRDLIGAEPPGQADCRDCPATRLTWFDALHLANEASRRDGLRPCYELHACDGSPPGMVCDGATPLRTPARRSCDGFRLPSEVEWARAVRPAPSGPVPGDASGAGLRPVCQGPRWGFGLCDVDGNVFNWTEDAWRLAPGAGRGEWSATQQAEYRVLRGGSYLIVGARLSRRDRSLPSAAHADVGVRLVRDL